MTEELEFDVVILGGGPAGLSAGIYASRGALKTAIIDVSMLGGQPSNYLELENYPGFCKVGGYELMEKFENHANSFGIAQYPMQEIKSVNLIQNPKVIQTSEYTFKTKAVIIATGAKPMKLGVKGEQEFSGRGVSYCAVCDGAFYKDKEIAVVGGGNSALEEAIYLTNFVSKVYLIHRRGEFRADKIVQERVFNNSKIEIVYDSVVNEIKGEGTVTDIEVTNVKTNEIRNISVEGIFPYIGLTPNVDLFSGQIAQDKRGFIETDNTMKTSVEGVYAIGDVRNTPLRQVITACSDGAVASVYAQKYIETKKEAIV